MKVAPDTNQGLKNEKIRFNDYSRIDLWNDIHKL